MEAAFRRQLVQRYREGPVVVAAALADISEAELDARPSEGWTAREIVHHLGDSEMTSAIRVRRLLAEDRPAIQGYDEMEFARRLHYGSRPIGPSLEALIAARASTAQILERLAPADWAREGTHSDSGRYTMEDWLEIYAAHAHDHAAQITRARSEARR